jgi:flagellar protein FliJ
VAVFTFRLASVLRYRERMKQEKQWEIDALFAARRRVEEELDALDASLQGAADAATVKEGQVISARELQLYGDYAHQVIEKIRERQEALKGCDEAIVLKRQELIEAMRSVKALEQLRTRFEERFRRERDREEQKFADEISQRKFADPQAGKKIPS